MAWANGYLYRTSAVVASGKITGTLTNWPALVSLSSANLATVAHSGAVQHTVTQTVGARALTVPADFLVTSDSAGSTQITGVEFESYDATAGTALIWVNVASAAVGSTIYIFYGNASVTTLQGTPSGAWNANYGAVYHFPDGSTLNTSDSSSNANNLTQHNAPTAGPGQIDGAIALASASTQYASGSPPNTAAISYTAWVNGTSFPAAFNAVMSATGTGATFCQLFVLSNGKLAIYLQTPTVIDYLGTGSHTLSTGTWYYIALTYDSVAGLVGYVNGASDNTVAASGAFPGTFLEFDVGHDVGTSGRDWNGGIDEVRVASVALSAAWIAADYNNQSAPGTFWTLTYDQTSGGSGAMVAAISAGATVAAALKGSGKLAAAITNSAPVAASLKGTGRLAAGLSASAAVVAPLKGSGKLAAAIPASATVSATAKGSGKLAAGIAASAAIVAPLKGAGRLAATIPASGTVAAHIKASGKLAAALAASATVSATHSETAPISSSISAGATVAAALKGRGRLASPITASAAVGAHLSAIGRLNATISSAANISAQMRAIGKLTAGINASATIHAMMLAISPISANIPAGAVVSGTLIAGATNLLRVKNTYANPLVPVLTATCLNADNSAKEIVNGT